MINLRRAWPAFFLLLASARAADSAAWDWQTHAPAFDDHATPSRMPTLLFFTAEWCGYCKQMERTTLADVRVRLAIGILRHVKLDLDRDTEAAHRFGVDAVPAFLLVNERGQEISRSVGVSDPAHFTDWLEAGEKQAADIATAAQARQAELQALAQAVHSTDPATQAQVRGKALALIARSDPASHEFANGYLTRLAGEAPALLLDGLDDPDLAVRIAVANILRAERPSLSFDPWAPSVERRASVDQLRKDLAVAPAVTGSTH